MEAKTDDTKKQFLLTQANLSKSNIKNQILKIYKELPENQTTNISKKDLENLLENVYKSIIKEIDKLCYNFFNADDINTTNEIKNIIDYKIESNIELNRFTSRDIQDENKVITRTFQDEANNITTNEEQVENEKVAIFCKKVAEISRMSYKASFILFKKMKDKFIELRENKMPSSDENFIKEFSSWIKSSEIEKNIFREYKDILNREFPFKINENSNEEKYLIKLFYNLTLLYFHCQIANPLVEIDFNTEDAFNSSKMIDFINRGKNRKVNFVILPSLFSNGCFLENGKAWVFTYLKNTFKFKEAEIKDLNNILPTQNSNIESNENDYEIKAILKNTNNEKYVVDIISNKDIPRNKRYEFALYVYDKNRHKTFPLITKLTHLEIEKNMEIVKCELRVDNKVVISSKNIIKEY